MFDFALPELSIRNGQHLIGALTTTSQSHSSLASSGKFSYKNEDFDAEEFSLFLI
jgi:hypothetical protein